MKSIKSILIVVVLAVSVLTTFGQSTDGISKIRQAQDLAVDRIVASLSATNRTCTMTSTAVDVKHMTDVLVLLQAAESRAYQLSNERDIAAQTMTTGAMQRSLSEASALGVSRSLRKNLEQEWSHARNLEQADRVVARVQTAAAERALVIADRGSFRRFLPEWMGGTSSYANYRIPQPEETGTALASKVGELEKRLMGLQALVTPTVTK